MKHFVTDLNHVIHPYPKRVSLTVEVDLNVPHLIVSDEVKLFRTRMR